MIRFLKIWWYRDRRANAIVDELVHRYRMRKAADKVAYYEEKIGTLQQSPSKKP